jgi:hypothetical protein
VILRDHSGKRAGELYLRFSEADDPSGHHYIIYPGFDLKVKI